MDALFERHIEYLSEVPMQFTRELMNTIEWDSRLVIVRGPKGVGKSTLLQQYILQHFDISDRHALYCSADTGYFLTHTIFETASTFVRQGGTHLFIDEIHKYPDWSREIKEIYDLYKGLKVILSGSSLIQLNDGQADLSRRADVYDLPGLSFREYLWFKTGTLITPVSLNELLTAPNDLCLKKMKGLHPLEHFAEYLRSGYYPFSFEKKKTFHILVENVCNYIIDNDLVKYRGITVPNARKIKAFIQIVSETVPFQVDISKLSKSIGIDRLTLLRYIRYLDEAKLIRNLYAEIDKVTDLQKPDKIFLDNTNLIYTFSQQAPEIGTVRECFFCNQLASAGHTVEYGGTKTGDFRIDNDWVIEVGGNGKDFSQIDPNDKGHSALAIDSIDIAAPGKIPLWAFGFLY